MIVVNICVPSSVLRALVCACVRVWCFVGWRDGTFIEAQEKAFLFFFLTGYFFLTEWMKLTIVVSWKPSHGNLIELSGD